MAGRISAPSGGLTLGEVCKPVYGLPPKLADGWLVSPTSQGTFTMNEQFWTDLDTIPGDPEFCSLGFLTERCHTRHNTSDFSLRNRPPCTNVSRQPRPLGWCGTYNDVSLYGRGVWRVVKSLPNGRCLIRRVTSREEIYHFLESVGYPELINELCVGKGGECEA